MFVREVELKQRHVEDIMDVSHVLQKPQEEGLLAHPVGNLTEQKYWQ